MEATIASFGRTAAFLFTAADAVAVTPVRSVSCPATLYGQAIREANLFQGAPSRMESLIPQDGGWSDVKARSGEPDRYFVCSYGKHDLTFHLPRRFTTCLFGQSMFDGTSGEPAVTCR